MLKCHGRYDSVCGVVGSSAPDLHVVNSCAPVIGSVFWLSDRRVELQGMDSIMKRTW